MSNLRYLWGALPAYNLSISKHRYLRGELPTYNLSISQKQKREVHEGLKSGKILLVIGTHPLLTQEIEFINWNDDFEQIEKKINS